MLVILSRFGDLLCLLLDCQAYFTGCCRPSACSCSALCAGRNAWTTCGSGVKAAPEAAVLVPSYCLEKVTLQSSTSMHPAVLAYKTLANFCCLPHCPLLHPPACRPAVLPGCAVAGRLLPAHLQALRLLPHQRHHLQHRGQPRCAGQQRRHPRHLPSAVPASYFHQGAGHP